MESIDFSFDFDYQQKYDSESVFKDLNNFENNAVLVQNQVINYANDMNRELVLNDVFLNQNNGFFDSIINNYEKKFNEEESDSNEDMDERESGFEEFFDDICGEESVDSLANQTLFGCICCHSCQSKSQKFMSETNHLIQHFRRQLKDFRENVRQHLWQFNSQINASRLDFTRAIVDLQIQLNQKNNQLERILNLNQFLSNNNELLINQSKAESLRFENVCKENIEYRNKLGIQLKVVLNSEDCKKAIKMYETFKLIDENISSFENVDNYCEDQSLNDSSVSDIMSQTSPQSFNSFKQLSPLNNIQNSNDLEQRIKDLLEKYEKKESIPSNNRKRRRERSITSPKKYQNCDTKQSERKHSERIKEYKNNSQIYLNKCPEKLLQNNVHKSSTISHVLTPITTYSKSGLTHKPLILSKSSHQSINSYTNCNQNNNNHHIHNGLHPKNKSSINKVYENSNQLNRLSNNNSNQSNELNDIKIEPQFPETSNDNLVKIDKNNGLKIKTKIPKGIKKEKNKRDSNESKRFCKRCNNSFPKLTSREFKEHIYNVCPARELVNKSLIKCDLCPREFMTSSALTSHRRSKHLKLMPKVNLDSN